MTQLLTASRSQQPRCSTDHVFASRRPPAAQPRPPAPEQGPRPAQPCAVALCGELDMGDLAWIREQVEPVVDTAERVVLDLSAVTFLDCAVLGLLVALSHRAEGVGNSLQVCGLQPHLTALVELFAPPPAVLDFRVSRASAEEGGA